VTEEDARDSHTEHWAAKRQGGYHSILRPGEYIALNERGQADRFHSHTVGHEVREIRAFLSALDEKPLPSLKETRKVIEEKYMASIDPRPWSDLPEQKLRAGLRSAINTGGKLPGAAIGAVGSAVRSGFKALNFVSSLGDLFSPRLTPEQKMEGEIAHQERRISDEQALRRRREQERSR
jgi:hypothetical protein